uniref:Solute carrier family 25 member 5 n=1 Tax=Taeniopygia guttata TaxID=59729 RepID=A0A674H652_TAEGU
MRPCPSPRISSPAGWRPPSPRQLSPPSRGSSCCCRCSTPASRSPPTSSTRASSTAWCASRGSRASSPFGAATWPM